MAKRLKGPIITLAAGVLVAAALLTADLITTKPAGQVADPPPARTNVTGSPTATPTPTATSAAVALPDGTYAGYVDGTSGASVAIAVKNGTAVAYVCDGKKAEAWLQGGATNGTVDLGGSAGSALAATYSNRKLTGTVRAAGHSWTFSVGAVAPPSGLYRASANVRQAKVVGGWIVLPDGRQVGVLDVAGEPGSAPPLNTTTLTTVVNGDTVTAAPVDGAPIQLGQ